MASVNKLSLRGVRSFSPEDDEQTIEFYFPCTIIVGKNGCGKTTIIESLRYAVTGALPPGAKSGQAFVHDPRSIGQGKVKGNVKLRFTSRSGEAMVVVRSMEVTKKKTGLSFKQLDGVLRMMDPNTGRKVSLSHKCQELDRQLPSLLGVSKPILEHVVFCHQEDSSWPLQEGAVLKKRFDDIFDSTRYTKALEAFRKTEKEMIAKVKDLNVELAGLHSSKNAADVFRKDLTANQDSLEEIEEEKQILANSIAAADKEIGKYETIQAEMDEVQDRIDATKDELAQVTQAQQAAIKFLEEDMTQTHTKEKLERMLRDFEDKVSEQIDRRDDLQAKYQSLEENLDKLRQQEMDLTSSMGKLAAEKAAHEKNQGERYQLMHDIAQTYAVDLESSGFSQGPNVSLAAATLTASVASQGGTQDFEVNAADITEQDMDGYFEALEKTEEDLNTRLKDFRTEAQAKEDTIQRELSAVTSQLDQVDVERKKLADRKKAAQTELTAVTKIVSRPNRFRMSDIEEARVHAKKFAKMRDEATQNPRRKEIPAEIQHLKNKIETLKSTISNDKITLEQSRSSVNMRNEVTMLRDQCRKELEILDESIIDQSFNLQKHEIEANTTIPMEDDEDGEKVLEATQGLEEVIGKKYDDAKSKASDIREDVSRSEKGISEKSAVLVNSQRRLHTVKLKRDRLAPKVDKIRNLAKDIREHERRKGRVADGDEREPAALLNYIEDRLSEVEKDSPTFDKAVQKVLKFLYKKAVVRGPDKAPTGEMLCPCCRRGFDGESGKRDLVDMLDKLKSELSGDPADADKRKSQYEEEVTTYQTWKKAVQASVEDLRDERRLEEECKTLQGDSEKLEKELKQYHERLDDDKKKLEAAEEDANEIRSILDAAKRWTQEAARIVGKKAQIQQKAEVVSGLGDDNGRDLETMEKEMSEKVEQKDRDMMKINELNDEMTALNNLITDLSTRASNTERSLREKEAKFAETEEANKRKKELSEELLTLNGKEKELQDKVAPLKQKMKSKEASKRQLRAASNSQEGELQESLSGFRADVAKVKEVTRKIKDYLSSDNDEDGLAQKLAKIAKQKEMRKAEIETIKPDLSQLNSAINDQERHKKQLQANIDVLEANSKIGGLENQVASLTQELEAVDGSEDVSEQLSTATTKKEEQSVRLAHVEGRRAAVIEQIRSAKRKLSSPDYKNVDDKYRICLINVETTKLAAEDIKKYGNALDKSILKFHLAKIGDINKIIRELWMLTYKGEDISTIELVSDQGPNSKASKSYNYRVVMTKGAIQLDMRGRCSAGQRVLASIVIRLALAETFCINCGCIALDEPTVNLDFATKKGLAVALAQLIASRSAQRNFQLILITHDEEFVTMMKTELATLTGFSMPEKYFQVRREQDADGKYYSKINPIDWDEAM